MEKPRKKKTLPTSGEGLYQLMWYMDEKGFMGEDYGNRIGAKFILWKKVMGMYERDQEETCNFSIPHFELEYVKR
jgi:hypothetical protein